jgi:oxygen-dependent protoporphyrinogen oxidase
LPPSAFYSLRGGLGGLVDALAVRLPAGSVRLEAPVRRLTCGSGGFALDTDRGAVEAARVIVAAPAPRASRLLEAACPEAAALLAGIPFVSTAVVFLAYRKEQVAHALDGYGLIVPRSEGLRSTACTFFSTKFPGRAPEGHVLLRVFLGGARDPGVMELPDDALVTLARTETATLLGTAGEPRLARVFRWRETTPQLEVGHLERVARLEAALLRVPGLFVTGAGVRGTGIPDAIADGARTAEAAARGLSA